MKYSIIVPFYNKSSFYNTMLSYEHHYGKRDDTEVVIVEDAKTSEEDSNNLATIISKWKDVLNIKHVKAENPGYMGGRTFNIGVLLAAGEFVLLNSPECFHVTNILAGLDEEYDTLTHKYVICACQNVVYEGWAESFEAFQPTAKCEWYQHSQYNNRRLHFCSSMTRMNYLGIGGIDENYSDGQYFDDDDFLKKIIQVRIPIKLRDDLLSYHIAHDRTYQYQGGGIDTPLGATSPLIRRNLAYFRQKWGADSR